MKNAKISNKVWEMYNPKEEIANEIFILSIVYLAKEKVLMLIYKISFHLKVKPTYNKIFRARYWRNSLLIFYIFYLYLKFER